MDFSWFLRLISPNLKARALLRGICDHENNQVWHCIYSSLRDLFLCSAEDVSYLYLYFVFVIRPCWCHQNIIIQEVEPI